MNSTDPGAVTHELARRSLGHLPDCGARLVVERYIDQQESALTAMTARAEAAEAALAHLRDAARGYLESLRGITIESAYAGPVAHAHERLMQAMRAQPEPSLPSTRLDGGKVMAVEGEDQVPHVWAVEDGGDGFWCVDTTDIDAAGVGPFTTREEAEACILDLANRPASSTPQREPIVPVQNAASETAKPKPGSPAAAATRMRSVPATTAVTSGGLTAPTPDGVNAGDPPPEPAPAGFAVTHPGCSVCGKTDPLPMFDYQRRAWLHGSCVPQPAAAPKVLPVEELRREIVDGLRAFIEDIRPGWGNLPSHVAKLVDRLERGGEGKGNG